MATPTPVSLDWKIYRSFETFILFVTSFVSAHSLHLLFKSLIKKSATKREMNMMIVYVVVCVVLAVTLGIVLTLFPGSDSFY